MQWPPPLPLWAPLLTRHACHAGETQGLQTGSPLAPLRAFVPTMAYIPQAKIDLFSADDVFGKRMRYLPAGEVFEEEPTITAMAAANDFLVASGARAAAGPPPSTVELSGYKWMVTPSASMLRARPLNSGNAKAAAAAQAAAQERLKAAEEVARSVKPRDLTGNTLQVDWSERSFVAARRAAPTSRAPRKRARSTFVTYAAPSQFVGDVPAGMLHAPDPGMGMTMLPTSKRTCGGEPSTAAAVDTAKWVGPLTPAMLAAQQAHAAATQAAMAAWKSFQGEAGDHTLASAEQEQEPGPVLHESRD